MCVPSYHDATNEILDLQRDLHVNDFALCEENTCGARTLQVAFRFSLERVIASLDAKGRSPPCFGAAIFLVGAFAVGCVLVQRMALLVTLGLNSSFSRFEEKRQMLQIRQKEYHESL